MADSICSRCDKPARSRGLCGKHYMAEHRPPRKVVEIPCAVCGVAVRKVEPANKRRSVCSNRCRYVLRFGRDIAAGRELVGPVPRLPQFSSGDPVAVAPSPKRVFVQGVCRWCGENFCRAVPRGGSGAASCSAQCSRRYKQFSYRDGGKRFLITRRRRLAIYARDGWVCQLCFDPVDPTLSPSDAWAATLDHIVPQSHMLIPDHSEANLRLAHRWCNSLRADDRYYTAADLAPAS